MTDMTERATIAENTDIVEALKDKDDRKAYTLT